MEGKKGSTLNVKAIDGVLVSIKVDIYENAKLFDPVCMIQETSEKYNGKMQVLQRSQTTALLFVEFDDADNKAKWIKYAKRKKILTE